MAMPLVAPRYTIADLDRFANDGNRYELLGGVLLVTPAPGAPHPVALGRLTITLSVYLGPSGPATVATPGVIQVDHDTQLEPDLLVIPARYADRPSWRQMTDCHPRRGLGATFAADIPPDGTHRRLPNRSGAKSPIIDNSMAIQSRAAVTAISFATC